MKIELIYCADGNPRFAEIAIQAGFLYGAQLPKKIYFDPYFVDQDFKRPNFQRYMEAIQRYRPYMASVLDWMRPEQLPEVMGWAESIAPFIKVLMIVPKVRGGIADLPRVIAGRPVRLGYSVPIARRITPEANEVVAFYECGFGGWELSPADGEELQSILCG